MTMTKRKTPLRQIRTENGLIEGIIGSDPRITVFRGVPYAAPPVGDLRWRSPQPLKGWNGVRKCDHFAPMAYQAVIGEDPEAFYNKEYHPTAPEYAISEDCLYFNMYSPAVDEGEKLPIYVWFHGGGLQTGYSYEMEFDGEHMAREGVIVVSVGYRLNIFSFMAHPELSAESPDGAKGNYGLEDVIFCIRWLKRNARFFGGDPDRITLGGQSGSALGAICIGASPMSEGLLSGIITMSGGGMRAFGYGSKCTPLHTAEQLGIQVLEKLGVSTVEEARKLPAEAVYAAYRSMKVDYSQWSPRIDDVFLKEDVTDAQILGHHHDIPYLFGSCANEGGLLGFPPPPAPETAEELKALAEPLLGEHTDEFMAEVGEQCDLADPEEVRALYFSDTFNPRTVGARAFALTQAEQGRKGYCYWFNHDIPGDDAGAFHGSDLWFVFGNLDKCWRPFTGRHYDLARKVMKYWCNFIKSGDPNGCDQDGTPLPGWLPAEGQDPFVMEFGEEPHRKTSPNAPGFDLRIQSQLSAAGKELGI